MNHIFSHAASVPQYFSTAFKEIILPQLTEKQKQVLVISSIAVSVLTGMYIAYRYFSGNTPPKGPPSGPSIISYVSPKIFKPTFGTDIESSSSDSSSDSPSPSPKIKKPIISTLFGSSSPKSPPKSPPFPDELYESPILSPIKPSSDPFKTSTRIPRTGLDGIEDDIKELQEEIYVQQQILEFSKAKPIEEIEYDHEGNPIIKLDDGIEFDPQQLQQQIEIEEKIKELKDDLSKRLANYPGVLRKYLDDKFSTYSHKDSHEIYDHLVMLSGFMESNAIDQTFIHDCLKQIDDFLSKSLFTSATEMCLQEQQKTDFIVFHEFLSIVDKHIKVITKKDCQLATNLKIKLANLPIIDHIDSKTEVPKDRKELFPNVHLSEQEQVVILATHFQSEEDKFIADVIFKIQTQKLSTKDLKKLSNMLSDYDSSSLSTMNKNKLRVAIKKLTGVPLLESWNANAILNFLKKDFLKKDFTSYSFQSDSTEILNLHRASKAKKFFRDQIGLPEEKIQIPRWYHATSHHNITLITNSGEVLVQHKQAFKGAWVSNRRETDFGGSVYVFSHRISKLDPNVFIGYEKGGESGVKGLRWRGLQCPIPLVDKGTKISNVSIFGIYKGASKSEKEKVIEDFKKKGISSVVVSVDQIDYIQREIIKTIGSPNLTAKWWGKADESTLDQKPPY